jgi:hypothetical protein
MQVKDLLQLDCTILNTTPLTTQVTGIFASDLLSHVMGHAKEGQVLVTVLNNINVLGVADLLDLSAVVFTHNTILNQAILSKADELEIPLLSTTYTTAEFIVEAHKIGI